METAQKVELLWRLGLLSIKKAQKVGGSYCVFLPHDWVELFCLKAGDNYWVQMSLLPDNSLLIIPLDEATIEGVLIKAREEV